MPVRSTPGATVLAISLVVVGCCAVLLGIGVGTADLDLQTVVGVVSRRIGLTTGADVTVAADRIVWELRAPRVVGALAVGALLAVCGVILQSLTRNELADPYLLGISSGASVGAVTVIVLGLSLPAIPMHLSVTVAAFCGALIALVAVLGLATGRSGVLPPGRTILAGVAVGQLCGAFVSLAIMVFGERDAARGVLTWTLGSLAGLRWDNAMVLAVVAGVALIVLLLASNALDSFAFGEVSASSLGVNVTRVRWLMLIGTALATACTVAVVGPIGFVGLTVPHLMRLAIGPVHRILLPMSALAGAVLLLVADTIARTIGRGSEIPIGVVTAVIGAPTLVVLLRRQATRS